MLWVNPLLPEMQPKRLNLNLRQSFLCFHHEVFAALSPKKLWTLSASMPSFAFILEGMSRNGWWFIDLAWFLNYEMTINLWFFNFPECSLLPSRALHSDLFSHLYLSRQGRHPCGVRVPLPVGQVLSARGGLDQCYRLHIRILQNQSVDNSQRPTNRPVSWHCTEFEELDRLVGLFFFTCCCLGFSTWCRGVSFCRSKAPQRTSENSALQNQKTIRLVKAANLLTVSGVPWVFKINVSMQ